MPVSEVSGAARDRDPAPSWWKSQAAPLEGVQLVAFYLALLVPPAVTLIFGGAAVWSYVLWIPAIVVSTVWGKARARRDGAPPRSVRRDVKANAVVAASVTIPIVVGSAVFDQQIREGQTVWVGCLGVYVVAIGIAIEPYFRRRYRESFAAADAS
jgi:hypothetical protein